MFPARFDQTAAVTARQVRFRHIGNPFSFLNAIGFPAIKEELYRGANVVDVAERINVSVTVLRAWLDDNGHMSEVDAASTLSADGYLSEGRRLLAEAQTDFELKKAKELINHARWLAERLNKPQYGKTEAPVGQAAGVQYNFFINGQAQKAEIHTPPLDGQYENIKPDVPQFSMPRVYMLPEPDNVGPFVEAPVDIKDIPVPEYLRS